MSRDIGGVGSPDADVAQAAVVAQGDGPGCADGSRPGIGDAELVTVSVMQALLGFDSERLWLRYARAHLLGLFPQLPGQSEYNKPLRRLADTMAWLVTALAARTAIATDDVWVVDSERHEALLNPAVVEGHRWRPVAASRLKLRAA